MRSSVVTSSVAAACSVTSSLSSSLEKQSKNDHEFKELKSYPFSVSQNILSCGKSYINKYNNNKYKAYIAHIA